MAYDDIGRGATNKYRSKFDLFQIRVPLGQRAQIAAHAALNGESINAFINRAIQETMARDQCKHNCSENESSDV